MKVQGGIIDWTTGLYFADNAAVDVGSAPGVVVDGQVTAEQGAVKELGGHTGMGEASPVEGVQEPN